MKTNHSPKEDLSRKSEFTVEEQQFGDKLRNLANRTKPKQEFINHLEAQIIGANISNNGRHWKDDRSDHREQKRPRFYTYAAVGFAAIVVVAVIVLAVPSWRAAARAALGFWIKTEDVQPAPTRNVITPVSPEQIPVIVETIEQVMEVNQTATPKPTQEEYIVKLPTRLPEGYQIFEVEMSRRGNAWINLSGREGGSILTLQIRPANEVEGTILGPEEKVVQVQFGNLTGEYVRGGWALNHSISGQLKPEEAAKLIWIDDGRYRKFRWTDGNLNYYLLALGGRHPGGQDYLGMNDLAAIAASMQPVNKSTGSYPKVKTFTADHGVGETDLGRVMDYLQLEALTGFDIPEASVTPENYIYAGGEVESIAQNVRLVYECQADTSAEYSSGVFAFDLNILKISEEELVWEREQFGEEEVGPSAVIENVTINGIPGEYVKGMWNYRTTDHGDEKFWDNSANYHTLKWYKDGFLYSVGTTELIGYNYQGPCLLTKESLIAFAESLK